MAFQPRCSTALLTKFLNCRTTRFVNLHTDHQLYYIPFSTPQILSKSNLDPSSINPTSQSSKLMDESSVLNQLSDIIPAMNNKDIIENSCKNELVVESAFSYLRPEERLRGVFLMKLRGKAALKKALDDVGVELDVGLVGRVVNEGSLNGEQMARFFDWAIERVIEGERSDVYHVVLKEMGKRKFFKHMMGLLHDMRKRGVKVNEEALLIVFDSYAKAKLVKKSREMFDRLEEFGFERNVESLNMLLQCLSRCGHVGYARRFVKEMKGEIEIDNTTYNILIGGRARAGADAEVENLLQEMVEDGYDPECLTYGYVLEGLRKAGKVDESVKVFQTLVESGSLLNTRVYNAMISNFVYVGNIDESLNYYRRMLSDKCEPDMYTYSRLISGLLRVRRVADAIEMFDEMIDRGIIPTSRLVTSFLEPLCSYGPPHAALMIYKKARKSGCMISLIAYKLLLGRVSKFGKCELLRSLWDEMQESGYSTDMEVYEYVINGLCNIGRLENAVLVMEEALKAGFFPSVPICGKLNYKLLSVNKVEMAYKLSLKIKASRVNQNARRRWHHKGWHF